MERGDKETVHIGNEDSQTSLETAAHFLTNFEESVVMVHARGMAIAPVDLDGVATNELHAAGTDSGLDGFPLNDPFASMLVHAACAGAEIAELDIGYGVFFAIAEG